MKQKWQWSNYPRNPKSKLTKGKKDYKLLIWQLDMKPKKKKKVGLSVRVCQYVWEIGVCVCESERESKRIRDWDSLPCNKRWQGDKLVLSTEIDYFVFPSSSYGSHTDALKHLNDTLEKTSQVGLVQCSFPSSPHWLWEWTAVNAAYIRGSAMQTSLDSLLQGDVFILYIRNPLYNPRSLNAKMTNVSDFVFLLFGYI